MSFLRDRNIESDCAPIWPARFEVGDSERDMGWAVLRVCSVTRLKPVGSPAFPSIHTGWAG
jgi:hypothetical protein